MQDITLTPSQQKAKELFDMGESLFLTGKAGTGKSLLTRVIVEDLAARKKKVVLCAPTGVAAVNVGGATLHRTFHLPVGVIEPYRSCKDKSRLSALALADVVIVDEISMCRQDLFAAVMNSLSKASRMRGATRKKQILVVGDFHQLPPVLTPKEETLYGTFYDGLYPFQSDAWWASGLRTVELQENMRQNDARYMSILDNIREGRPDFGWLNARCSARPDPEAISVCTTNRQADAINAENLARISGAAVSFRAETDGEVGDGDMCVPELLELKVGARVMSVVNNGDEYSNGSIGTVTKIGLEDAAVEVRMDHNGRSYVIAPQKWSIYDYGIEKKTLRSKDVPEGWDREVDAIEKKEIGWYRQFPLKLAWAVTVHKSQGATFDRVNIYADQRFFAPGQLYVALSRCRTLEGMNIIGQLTASSIVPNPAVIAFMQTPQRPSDNLFF